MDTSKRCIIYIASGQPYINQAARSAKSIGDKYDTLLCVPNGRVDNLAFTEIILLPDRESHWYLDSVRYFNTILSLGYDEFLYLDCDTFICGDLEPFFEALAKYDLVTTHAIGREITPNPDIPDSFPEPHIGAIAFKNNDKIMWLFEDWLSVMEDNLNKYKDNDQAALREALWMNDEVNLGILPSEFCFRFRWGGLVSGSVRVLHGKEHDRISYEKMAQEVNARNDIRVFHRRELA